jgi:hypothetical protein
MLECVLSLALPSLFSPSLLPLSILFHLPISSMNAVEVKVDKRT